MDLGEEVNLNFNSQTSEGKREEKKRENGRDGMEGEERRGGEGGEERGGREGEEKGRWISFTSNK